MSGQLRLPLQELGGGGDGVCVLAVNGHQVVLPEKEADVDRVEVVRVFGGLAEGDCADDKEQILVELLQLDPRLRVDGFLYRQRMEAEGLPEDCYLSVIPSIDVDPERANAGPERAHNFVPRQVLPNRPVWVAVATPEMRLG